MVGFYEKKKVLKNNGSTNKRSLKNRISKFFFGKIHLNKLPSIDKLFISWIHLYIIRIHKAVWES